MKDVKDEMGFDIMETLKVEKAKRREYDKNEQVEASWIPIINDMNRYKLVWDMFILFLAVCSAFTVGFEFVIQWLNDSPMYQLYGWVNFVLFTIDIFI